MANTRRKPHFVSPEEYLALEDAAQERSEYVDGEIFAMTGTTILHNQIAGNLYLALRNHLHDRPCRTFFADIKVDAARGNAFYYPDLVVRCQPEPLSGDAKVISDPTLIIEVLSPSTEATDRREKLAAYRKIATLQEYVLVAQDEPSVEIYRRQGDVGWNYLAFGEGEAVTLSSIDLTLAMAAIYGQA